MHRGGDGLPESCREGVRDAAGGTGRLGQQREEVVLEHVGLKGARRGPRVEEKLLVAAKNH